ncbi:hypothetical protein COCON_G00235570 [Conger conger]|uniref:Uncharacterized protein n=1 Tax=Conger conger TaxID=82655 RepID=A0A9Q1HMJ5_CONCO|nr:hypothetical protein COCON_G00235570 [Conger conger]
MAFGRRSYLEQRTVDETKQETILPWSNAGLRALLKGPTAVRILLWLHQGSNH